MKLRNPTEFEKGWISCCVQMLAGHGDDTMIREALRDIRLGELNMSKLDSFDVEKLQASGYPRKSK